MTFLEGMPRHLSHLLERLKVSGNQIVQAGTGTPVLLRGVCRSGLEYSAPDANGSLINAGITGSEINHIVTDWGANIIRLPFNQDWALARPGYNPTSYLEALDFVIDTAASLGAYTLLDLQWLDASTARGRNQDGSINFVAPLPNLLSAEVWRQLAARYSCENAVLYDIFNEPHDALPNDPVALAGIRSDGSTFPIQTRRVTMAEWQPWATYLINEIRGENPDALIFVSGVNWGYDLSGFPLTDLQGLVYSTHIYRNKGSAWDTAFGNLASTHPVFAAEWGGAPEDLQWGQKLARYMSERSIGWTAWSWSDKPRLIEAPGAPAYRPTPFGQVVQNALRSA